MDEPNNPMHRIGELETSMTALQEQSAKTSDCLADILAKLDQLTGASEEPEPRRYPRFTSRNSSSERSTGRTRSKKNPIKPAVPADFDGSREKGRAFLFSCRAYLRLCPDSFDDDQQMITWAMTYMKAGRAARWAQSVMRREEKLGREEFEDWEAFEAEFRKHFTPANAEATAINILEGTSYYQGNRTVDDYLDDFHELIYDSGYTDNKTIVVKFRRGLRESYGSQIATMAGGGPRMNDPEGWYAAAIQLDQDRATNEAFKASNRGAAHKSPAATPGLFRTAVGPSAMPRAPSMPTPPARFAHTTPSPGNPVPMDIDAARGRRTALPPTCYRCKQVGHLKADCPRRFDVRYLEADELQTHLEDKFAQIDVANAQAGHATESGEGDAEVTEEEDADFPARSG